MGGSIVPLLAAAGAGVASGYSPQAARGISAGANVLGMFGERRDRQARDQRIAEQLAQEEEERRRKNEARGSTDQFIENSTDLGPPFNPPMQGIGQGLKPHEARLAQLLNQGNTGSALQYIEEATRERPERQAPVPDRREEWDPTKNENALVARDPSTGREVWRSPSPREPRVEREASPTIRSEYGRDVRIDPETGKELWSRTTRTAPREPKEPAESKKLTALQMDNLRDEITSLEEKLEAVKSDEDTTTEQKRVRMKPYVAAINRKRKMLGEKSQLRVEGDSGRAPAGRSPARAGLSPQEEADRYLRGQ